MLEDVNSSTYLLTRSPGDAMQEPPHFGVEPSPLIKIWGHYIELLVNYLAVGHLHMYI